MNEIAQVSDKFGLFDYMPVGCCILRQDFVVLFWNQCLENWTKIPRTEAVGTNLSHRFSHLNQPKYQIRFHQVFANGLPAVFSPQLHQSLIPAPLPNGKWRIQQTTVTAIPMLVGEGFYALVVIQDVTELTQRIQSYQEELTQRQLIETELKRSNAELEQFAYIASHDLQEPLRMVNNFTQLLAQNYYDKLDAEANQIIDFAVDGATRMQALIKDLLNFSRVHRQGKAFELSDCETILDLAINNLQLLIEESHAQICRNPLPTVLADENQLVQLFQNLIGNSIKYRSEQPPKINLGATQQEDQWLFWVRDNGIGINPKHSERIFLIFQRLHDRQEYSGTGIGLAICKKIVERHGGNIWVESEQGKGCTFYFTINTQKSYSEKG